MPATIEARAAAIQLLVLDVDGVLTDGSIYYGNQGEELKAFSIKDGLGIKLLQRSGIEVAIITGRNSEIVNRRASELGIKLVVQGREDKRIALRELCQQLALAVTACAYMGDDLPDLGAINDAGLGLTVADACAAVATAADWQAQMPGGRGAVREAAEFLLQARGQWQALEADYQ